MIRPQREVSRASTAPEGNCSIWAAGDGCPSPHSLNRCCVLTMGCPWRSGRKPELSLAEGMKDAGHPSMPDSQLQEENQPGEMNSVT